MATSEVNRHVWLTLDILIHRLKVERDGCLKRKEPGVAQGLDRAIEVLTISRDAHGPITRTW